MTATIDEQFIEYIVKTLVGNPDKVKIERSIDERGVLLQLHVDPEDLGRVIGRSGTTAKSIRTLLRALGIKNDARYNLKIVDDGEGRPPRRDERQDNATPADEPTSDSTADSDTAGDTSSDATDEPADQPAEPVAEEPAPVEEASGVDRHREDLKDLTDLDI